MSAGPRGIFGFAHAALALGALGMMAGPYRGHTIDISLGYPYGRRREPRPHDAHVEARERHLSQLAAKERAAVAQRAKLERDRPMIEAADAKRARRNAKRMAMVGPRPLSGTADGRG